MIVNVHLVSGPFFSIGNTFHVIAFFFTAGVIHALSKKWNSVSISDFFQQRFLRLMYPYLTLSICYVCLHLLLNIIRGDAIFNEVIKDSLIQTVTFKGIGTLWFLPVLFFGEVFYFISKKKGLSDIIIIILGVFSVFLSSYLNSKGICGIQWYGNYSLYGIFINTPLQLFLASVIVAMFMGVGAIIYKYLPSLFVGMALSRKHYLFIAIICVASLLVDLWGLNWYEGDLHKLNIGNSFIYLVCSISGILFVFSLAIIIERCIRFLHPLLLNWGKNSLIIMTTHTEYYINSVVHVAVMAALATLSISIDSKVVSGVSLLLIMLVEIGIAYIVNHSFLRYLYSVPKKTQS